VTWGCLNHYARTPVSVSGLQTFVLVFEPLYDVRIGQRGRVPKCFPFSNIPLQAPHDLAEARFGQVGGNPDLDSDRRNVSKIGANWKPLAETDLRLRAEYVRSRLDRPVSSFPGVSAALEEAFPGRFVRDSAGELLSVDFRPVNYDRGKRDTLRIGFDFSKPLRSARPSQAQIDALRARARAGRSAQAVAAISRQPV
jgi:hypothetical protein